MGSDLRWSPTARLVLRLVLAPAVVLVAMACESNHPMIDVLASPPALAPLDTISILGATPGFMPSGVAVDSTCAITLVGRTWGTLVRLDPQGRTDSTFPALRTERRLSSLESGGGRVIVWASEPALLAEVTDDGLDSIPIPEHAWGGKWVGPAVPVGRTQVAIAPISNRRVWVPSPDPWVDAPFFLVVEGDRVVFRGGRLANPGGRYLTWLTHRAVLGARGETVHSLTLSDGELRSWVPGPGAVAAASGTHHLPPYFEAPEPREQVRSHPGLSAGGDVFVHWEVSHVVTAAFGGDRIFAIRNYDAEWIDDLDNSFDPNALWRPTNQGLEVYDLSGERLAAIALPSSGASWIRADDFGRVFLGVGDGILVARDPTSPSPCPALPPLIELAFEDRPPLDEEQ